MGVIGSRRYKGFARAAAAIIFVAALLVAALIPSSSAAAETTLDPVFYISSEFEFNTFLSACTQSGAFEGRTVILTEDIYLTRKNYDNSSDFWRAEYFAGTFEGGGHSIVGFSYSTALKGVSLVQIEGVYTSVRPFAFFGEVESGAVVRDLNFVGTTVDGYDNLRGVYTNAAAVAGVNRGVIENVRVSGSVAGLNAGGIAVQNFGQIDGCAFIGELEAENLLGGVTALQEAGASITDCSLNSTTGEQLFLYSGSEESGSELIEAGAEISDYFELIWWLELSADEGGIPVSQKNDINLFSTPLPARYSDYIDEIGGGTDYARGDNGFYNDYYYSYAEASRFPIICWAESYPESVVATPLVPSNDLSGAGTKDNPYLISSSGDIAALPSFSGAGVYFKLTRDLSLKTTYGSYYGGAEDYLIQSFQGNFDGGGYSITGLMNGALFGEIASGATVKNLLLRGAHSKATGLLAHTNHGQITACEARGVLTNSLSGGFVNENYGDFYLCTSRTSGAGGAFAYISYAYSNVRNCRNLGELPFFGAESAGAASSSYNSSSEWNFGGIKSRLVGVSEGGTHYVEGGGNFYTLVTVPKTTAAVYYSTGWKFADSANLGWGFFAGRDDDVPVLVMPADNMYYKYVTSYAYDSGASLTSSYGQKSSEENSYDVVTADINSADFAEKEWYAVPSGYSFTESFEKRSSLPLDAAQIESDLIDKIGAYAQTRLLNEAPVVLKNGESYSGAFDEGDYTITYTLNDSDLTINYTAYCSVSYSPSEYLTEISAEYSASARDALYEETSSSPFTKTVISDYLTEKLDVYLAERLVDGTVSYKKEGSAYNTEELVDGSYTVVFELADSDLSVRYTAYLTVESGEGEYRLNAATLLKHSAFNIGVGQILEQSINNGGNYFVIGTCDGARYIKTSTLEFLMTENISTLRAAYIAAGDSFVWKRGGTEIGDGLLGQAGNYSFILLSDYLMIIGSIDLSEIQTGLLGGILIYTVTVFGTARSDIEANLLIPSLAQKTAAKGELSYSWEYKSASDTVYSPITDGYFAGIGSYRVTSSVAGNSSVTAYSLSAIYSISPGTISYTAMNITTQGGWETSYENQTSKIYNYSSTYTGSNFTPAITLTGFFAEGLSITANITGYTPFAGSATLPGVIRDAGTYTLSVTISAPNYNPLMVTNISVIIYRASVTVGVLLGGAGSAAITFYDNLPTVGFTFSRAGLTQANLEASSLGYTTLYQKGSAVGSYTVAFNCPEQSNPNFILTPGAQASLSVGQATLDLSEAGFQNSSYVYNGGSRSIALDKSQIILSSGDSLANYTFTLTYYYGEESRSQPFAFTEAGEYLLSVKVTASPANYAEATLSGVKLIISRLNLNLTADNKTVIYGAPSPAFTYTARTAEGAVVTSPLLTGVTLSCSYNPASVTTYEYPITLSAATGNNGVNYYINTVTNGVLTVNKKVFDAASVLLKTDSYTYTGSKVVLLFKDGSGADIPSATVGGWTFSDWKKLLPSDGIFTPLEEAPINASDNFYSVEVTTSESAEYLAGSFTAEFKINKATLPLADIYLYGSTSGSLSLTAAPQSAVYNGTSYTVNIDASGLPAGEQFSFSYLYYLTPTFTEGNANQINPATPSGINFKDVVTLYGMTVTINGNPNYNEKIIDLYRPNGEYLFRVTPKEIAFTAPATDVYAAKPITPQAVLSGSTPLVAGDSVTFSVAEKSGKTIEEPGAYTLVVTINNTNYALSASEQAFTVTAASIDLNLISYSFTYEYGTLETENRSGAYYAKNIVIRNYTLNFSGTLITADITLIVNTGASLVSVGNYNISGAADYKNAQGATRAAFNVINGEGKITVTKRTIDIKWSEILNSSYVYNGSVISPANLTILKSNLENPPVYNIAAWSASFNSDVKHVGQYLATLNTDPVINASFIITNPTYTVTVTPASLRYAVENTEIALNANIPSSFNLVYESGASPFAGDNIKIVFSTDYSLHYGTAGQYDVTAAFTVLDGGQEYADYAAEKTSSKELRVSYLHFQNLQMNNVTAVYSGAPISPAVSGLPEGASVAYDLTPSDVGEYTVTATISKTNYVTETLTATVKITKATPVIEVYPLQAVLLRDGLTLSGIPINAAAYFNEQEVEGNFAFRSSPVQALLFGEHTYKIEFTPSSGNWNKVTGIDYTVTTYINVGDLVMHGSDGSTVPESVVSNTAYSVSLATVEGLSNDAVLYVNGVKCDSGEFIFTETKTYLIEVMVNYNVVYTTSIDFELLKDEEETPPEKPATPDKGDKGGNSGGTKVSMSEEAKQKWIIIGSSVGGGLALASIAAVVIVVVVKKKRWGNSQS